MSTHSCYSNAANSYRDCDNPDALLNDASLTHKQKLKSIKAWAVDSRALACASAEGLSGGGAGLA